MRCERWQEGDARRGCSYMTDFRLHKVYENGLKSVKNKCNNWKETSLRNKPTILDPILGTFIRQKYKDAYNYNRHYELLNKCAYISLYIYIYTSIYISVYTCMLIRIYI
jgi:hypothetical protein